MKLDTTNYLLIVNPFHNKVLKKYSLNEIYRTPFGYTIFLDEYDTIKNTNVLLKFDLNKQLENIKNNNQTLKFKLICI